MPEFSISNETDMIYDTIWYDMIYDTIRYNMIYMIRYDIWYVIWYDTVRYDTMWYIWYDMVWYMIWYDTVRYDRYDMIRYDMIRHDMTWYDTIHLLTAIVLTPGGSSTVHIYTHTIHRTTQTKHTKTQWTNWEECGPCPVFASYTFCLTTEEKAQKTLSRGSRRVPIGAMKTEY